MVRSLLKETKGNSQGLLQEPTSCSGSTGDEQKVAQCILQLSPNNRPRIWKGTYFPATIPLNSSKLLAGSQAFAPQSPQVQIRYDKPPSTNPFTRN